MKNIMNIILLSPILVFIILLLINSSLLIETQTVNIFWIWEMKLPVVALISLIFLVYVVLMYFSWKLTNFFTNNRNKNLEQENLELKGKLSDLIPDINKNLDWKIKILVDDFKSLTDKSLELHKKETSKVLGNLEFEINDLKEKINNQK